MCEGLKSIRIGQSAAKTLSMRNVQRLSRKGVGPSGPKRAAPATGEDIVCSLRKRKACMMVTSLHWKASMDDTKRVERDVQRFHSGYVVNDTTGCWEWQRNIQANGYGHMKHSGKARLAHRVSYEMHSGEIPDGAYVLHRCDNRICVNPQHLFLGTAMDNRRDMQAKRRRVHGERVNTAKLTEAQIFEIYALSDSGMGSPRIAKKYGISTAMAWNIKVGKSWVHLFSTRYGSNASV